MTTQLLPPWMQVVPKSSKCHHPPLMGWWYLTWGHQAKGGIDNSAAPWNALCSSAKLHIIIHGETVTMERCLVCAICLFLWGVCTKSHLEKNVSTKWFFQNCLILGRPQPTYSFFFKWGLSEMGTFFRNHTQRRNKHRKIDYSLQLYRFSSVNLFTFISFIHPSGTLGTCPGASTREGLHKSRY